MPRNQNPVFIHSLFRSGSTYFYNALKRTGNFHVYHEPFHEVIATLSNSIGELRERKEQMVTQLRHDFLTGGYFDEYLHLLPGIEKTFDISLSFDSYFMGSSDDSPEMKAYIDLLVDSAPLTPILQCTRTIGRLDWLMHNFSSQNIFLMRNPWDQWYSYKVNVYIASTPRLVYAQTNKPDVLKAIFEESKISQLIGANIHEKVEHCISDRIPPEKDYFLFFGLWVYAFIVGALKCDTLIDMDELSSNEVYRKKSVNNLKDIGIFGVDFSDAKLYKSAFSDLEIETYRTSEERVLDLFREYGFDTVEVRRYLEQARSKTFLKANALGSQAVGMLEDIQRTRELLFSCERQLADYSQHMCAGDNQVGRLSNEVERLKDLNAVFSAELRALKAQQLELHEGEVLLTNLNLAISERDRLIVDLSRTLAERDGQITTITDEVDSLGNQLLILKAQLNNAQAQTLAVIGSNSWRLTLLFREVRRWFSSPSGQAKRYAKKSLTLAKRGYQSLPISFQTKAKHRRLMEKFFPLLLRASGSYVAKISISSNYSSVINQEVVVDYGFDASSIFIQSSKNPLVSVVIPVYGKIEYTLHCLASIASHRPDFPFEVIVVDDYSSDESFDILSKIQGIRLLRNKKNQGFINTCNNGAKAALGCYLYFLNNDTEVRTGWLDELLLTFSGLPGTGLVGSKLIYPNGQLQEAGNIIWQDGSAWNFGRSQDPSLPMYNYAREVDYCSGASLMVPKALFDEIGGFDEHYLPAYCEDSDLALKIRNKGYRIIYQPLSVVIHFEGITSGTDLNQGIKSHQVENTKKLFARWQQYLIKLQSPGCEAEKAKDRRATRRVLVLDHCTPTPNQDAGSVTVFNILLLLREMNFQVTFIPEDNFLFMPEYSTALQRAGIEVLYAPHVTSVSQHLKECGQRYDLALLFRPGVVTRHLINIRKYCLNAKVLYHTIDLHYLRLLREAELESDKTKKKAAEGMLKCELAAIGSVDATIVHSTTELDLLRPLLPKSKIHVFPLILEIQGTSKSYRERSDIVFVGGYSHIPNIDAVKYFAEEVMPLVRKKVTGVRFYIVGSNPPAEIKALASEDIVVVGFVEDLTSLLDKMRVSVAPLRYGAGIKGKIGSAMAVGLPVVATALAAEGMSLTHGENILVADGAEALADILVEIYRDEAQWNQISLNSLAFAEKAWGAETAWRTLAAILADMGMKVERGSHPLSLFSKHLPAYFEEPKLLQAIGSAKNRIDFNQLLASNAIKQIDQITQELLNQAHSETFTVDGFCSPCNKNVSFLVDMQSGGQRHAHSFAPNWRERLECPLCRMNNRQRLISTLIKQELSNKQGQQVYLMEQVTPIFNWATTTFKHHKIVGSEYLGHKYPSGAVVKGLRHEDIENMSFPDNYLDLIISNDVFEHVPNPPKAFAECARVLKMGGIMLATIPFHRNNDVSTTRARLHNGQVENIMPPAFHGNPVSTDGSLVFTDFGWDLLATIKEAGFSDVAVDIYASVNLAHLGGGQLVFRAVK